VKENRISAIKAKEANKGNKKKWVVEMSRKNKVEMQIPREELENIDALVREGYYGNRNDAIKDILQRGAVYTRLRLRYKILPFFYFFSLSR